MPGQFHSAVFDIYNDELRDAMTAWLTEQSAKGWEPVSIMIVASKRVQTPQAFVVIRRELT